MALYAGGGWSHQIPALPIQTAIITHPDYDSDCKKLCTIKILPSPAISLPFLESHE